MHCVTLDYIIKLMCMYIQLKGKNIRRAQLDHERFQFLYLTLTLNQALTRN